MTDLSLDDLADRTGDATDAAEAASDAAESGESMLDMIQFLDDRGYLGPLLFGAQGGGGDAPELDTTADTDGPALTAENIAAFGDAITSQVGDMPLSQVVEYAKDRPDEVDTIIQNNL